MLLTIAWIYLGLCVACAVVIAADLVLGHAQHMWIMDVVWPLTALWAGPLALWAYFRYGRAGAEREVRRAREEHRPPPSTQQPFAVLAGKGATHCGSGCLLGDVTAEMLALALPFTLFGHTIFGTWIYDLILAFAFGIAFQYLTIKPMRGLSRRKGLVQAVKADTLSLLAWQVGMYGWMAIATFALFHRELDKGRPLFWFMMQLAMCLGFVTSYPVNRWLLRQGIKEKM